MEISKEKHHEAYRTEDREARVRLVDESNEYQRKASAKYREAEKYAKHANEMGNEAWEYLKLKKLNLLVTPRLKYAG